MDDSTGKKSPCGESNVSRKGKLLASLIILLFLVNIAVSAASVYVYDQYFAQKVATLDIREYVQDRKALFLDNKLTEDQFLESVMNIESTLDNIDKRYVVILGDSVGRQVRNAKKITITD